MMRSLTTFPHKCMMPAVRAVDRLVLPRAADAAGVPHGQDGGDDVVSSVSLKAEEAFFRAKRALKTQGQ